MVFEGLRAVSSPELEKGGPVVDPGPAWSSWTLEDIHFVTDIPHKFTSGVHFLRENEGSLKINADSTTLLLARFRLTRKKSGYFHHHF